MKLPVVSTQWLEANLNKENVVVVDASMSKVIGREPIVYERKVFIPNSKKLDLEKTFCNTASQQPHAFPTQEQFTVEAQKLGINSDSIVIIYDNQGIYSAPRAWWIFQAMGLESTYVVDGGLPKWLSENRQTTYSLAEENTALGNIQGDYRPDMVCDSRYLFDRLGAEKIAIVDARSVERFKGLAPEPRPGIRSGRIPGSLNVPFSDVLNQHSFKDREQLAGLFSQMPVTEGRQLVFTCGSGVTACILLLASVIAGYEESVLYDGSWSDWGSNHSLPVETD